MLDYCSYYAFLDQPETPISKARYATILHLHGSDLVHPLIGDHLLSTYQAHLNAALCFQGIVLLTQIASKSLEKKSTSRDRTTLEHNIIVEQTRMPP